MSQAAGDEGVPLGRAKGATHRSPVLFSIPVIAALATLVSASFAAYLWPALRAPVVTWSDSTIDLELARRGVGILTPPSEQDLRFAGVHPIKPGFIAFLALASRIVSGEEGRSVVIVQSILLLSSLLATSWYIAKRSRWPLGLVLYGTLLSCLRLRDATSAVMSEAIAVTCFVPLVALALFPPRHRASPLVVGVLVGWLALARPNLGAIALMVVVVGWVMFGAATSRTALMAATALAVVGTVWLVTRSSPEDDPIRGLGGPLLFGSANYYWSPSLGDWPQDGSGRALAGAEVRLAAARWRRFLDDRDRDTSRQLVWRAFHGLFGTEYYDARWSGAYKNADFWSKVATPFLTVVSIAALLTACAFGDRRAGAIGMILLLAAVLQSLVFGSLPRLVLPLLPSLWLVALVCIRAQRRKHKLVILLLASGGLMLLRANRHVLDWEWGLVEKAGVTLRQELPRGALPYGASTFHIRIAAPLVPAPVAARVMDPDGRALVPCQGGLTAAREPVVAFAIPESLSRANRERRLFVDVTGVGTFGQTEYLLFPVIPPPWGASARRLGDASLSPSTGILAGSFDWWVNPGPCPE